MTEGEQPDSEPQDDLVTSPQVIGTGRNRIAYTATTGRMVLREEVISEGNYLGGKAHAEIFHTSYVVDAPQADRPVVFAFNGGPGSSSVWLHMGLLGPRRVVMGDAGSLAPPPYALADNLQSLLAVADLVFIDPVTTGFSRPTSGHQADDFHGFTRDLESVAEFIRLWTTRNRRWLSPKYLAGESYGTTRAAALAAHLAEHAHLYLNGVILISSVLDFGSIHFSEGNDLPYALYLPTYTAAAHYHKMIKGDLQTKIKQAEEFASGDLLWALARGHRLQGKERTTIVNRYAELTGLDAGYVDRADLRVSLPAFVAELLRQQKVLLGRLDLRFTGWLDNPNGDRMDYDPADAAIGGPYSAAFNGYVRNELGYASDLRYNILTPQVRPWSYKEFENAAVQVSTSLTKAMRANEHLQILVACGYYDGATPYFAAEHVFAHLRMPGDQLQRIEWRYYEAGHMMYVHEPSRIKLSQDMKEFVDR